MTRTTTPDAHTATIRRLRERRAAGLISAFAFAAALEHIWAVRHGRA